MGCRTTCKSEMSHLQPLSQHQANKQNWNGNNIQNHKKSIHAKSFDLILDPVGRLWYTKPNWITHTFSPYTNNPNN